MSALIGQAKAARILGKAMIDKARGLSTSDPAYSVLFRLGEAYIEGAHSMEQAMRDESDAFNKLRQGGQS